MTEMTREKRDYGKGDWVVHLYHGVGQVRGIVKRKVNGKKNEYYRVRTENSTLFIPVEEFDEERLRPAATRSELEEAIHVLEREPKEMADDHHDRRRRIRNVKADGSLSSMMRLVRDLSWRRYDKKLNNTEERALRRFKDRLVREWAVALDVTNEEARRHLNRLLRRNRPESEES